MFNETSNTRVIGNVGEQLACELLIEDGYQILERNFRVGKLEIDIIAKKTDKLAFVEVKMEREKADKSDLKVNYKKRKHIIAASNKYLSIHNLKNKINFSYDIIRVLKKGSLVDRVHIKNAFNSRGEKNLTFG